MNKTITIMADYCATGLWYEFKTVGDDTISQIPKFLLEKFKKWNEDWENMADDCNIFRDDGDVITNHPGFKAWQEQSQLLAQELGVYLPDWDIEIFKEE